MVALGVAEARIDHKRLIKRKDLMKNTRVVEAIRMLGCMMTAEERGDGGIY
jgi:hypothetical protein